MRKSLSRSAFYKNTRRSKDIWDEVCYDHVEWTQTTTEFGCFYLHQHVGKCSACLDTQLDERRVRSLDEGYFILFSLDVPGRNFTEAVVEQLQSIALENLSQLCKQLCHLRSEKKCFDHDSELNSSAKHTIKFCTNDKQTSAFKNLLRNRMSKRNNLKEYHKEKMLMINGESCWSFIKIVFKASRLQMSSTSLPNSIGKIVYANASSNVSNSYVRTVIRVSAKHVMKTNFVINVIQKFEVENEAHSGVECWQMSSDKSWTLSSTSSFVSNLICATLLRRTKNMRWKQVLSGASLVAYY